MRYPLVLFFLTVLSLPAAAAEMKSEYTDIDFEKSCSSFSANQEGGDFANFVCPGWRGYPVVYYTGDLRESVFYGFPPAGGDTVWESFSAFNSTAPKIEWRIEVDGDRQVPIAAIHRWSVSSDPDDSEKKTEVLVVEKVGQIGVGEGCTVGLVVASGNPKANETARKIADEQVRDFACGADERVVVSGDVALPDFDRQEN
ncbi:hypothetical protein RB623_00790 [Mesorhizobium sp. LHD-90]|uniref:hypothetical protein n=1 Tax=Mesorhizobium sp. LHD-90 TaxID=3071414 RepID=UPI0027E08C06|nr:hypothetical protein [Mesorhizobium sp. LHD-90]MDQ6432585.1 hypothetical protein [Mesorhizobium sp. LHD-90]